jgi:ABC-type multidrug transport system fused ATPase/permease subunit
MKTAFVPSIVSPLVCFFIFSIEAYVKGTNRLSAEQAFSSLAIIALMANPVQDVLQSIPSIAMSTGCLERIQTFLLSDAVEKVSATSDTVSRSSSADGNHSVELREIYNNNSENGIHVSVENASIKSSPSASFSLHNINLQILRGSLTMVIGIVRSGKSSLLKAIIRELACEEGKIINGAREMAYCSQTAWLQNATVRRIVCGPAELWYSHVMHASAFDEEVLNLPDRDDTIIGSRGVTLSGGQK